MARTIEGGITLVDLTDGQSYYTFVRYSKNADGSGYVDTPSSETIYIGVYAGPLSSPPVYSDSGWTWSKYVGDDGGQGPQGVSVTSGRELYYLTTTGTAPSQITAANQIVSTDTPNRWSSVVATYQTGADYYTCIETTLSNEQKVWSAPSKNIALTTASADAQEAKTIATGINQYFWWIPNDHSTSVKAGVYMTQIPSATFKDTPAGGNIIMRSDGMYIRHGATLDAQVTSSGLTVKKGGIEAGTFNSNNYVYAWSEDRSDRALAINGSGSKTDWRFLAGKQFGVDKAGNLYASGANIQGQVTITAGSNVYTKDEVDDAVGEVNADLSRAKSEIKVTTDGISSEVSKKTDKDSIISTIRQSAETVKIKASQVEIDGTATFNAIKSSTDAAYDTKGAASAALGNAYNAMGGFTILWDSNAGTTYAGGEAKICKYDPETGTVSQAAGWAMWNGTKRTVPNVEFNPNSVLPYNIPIYLVLRLSSATSTTGTVYPVWYASGWKYNTKLSAPAAADTADWTWVEATDMVLGKCVEPSVEGVFTECETYNPPWNFKAVSNITTTAASAQSTANAAAPKTSAVAEEQYIYISKASGTTSVNGTTSWVTESGDKQNTWTTKRPTYNSSYPVLFVAKQKKVVSGTVTCTTPVKDDTTTIIDGGHITTGTIDASKATITNINGANILTNSIGANQIKANAIDTSKLTVGAQDEMLNSKIEIGGRNLLLKTATSATGTMASDTNAQLNPYYMVKPYSELGLTTDDYVTISFDYSYTNGKAGGTIKVGTNAGPWEYFGTLITTTAGSNSGHIKSSFKVTSALAASTGNNLRIRTDNCNGMKLTVSNVKLEKGNKATDWTPAPEDLAATATSYITDIGNDGIRVHPASTENNSVLINSDGMTVYKGGTADTNSVAFYGDTARIGKKASRHVEVKTGGMQVYNDVSSMIAHIGYESVQGETGATMGAFFTFGKRKSNQTKGEFSVAEGHNTTASGFCSHAEGQNTTASGLGSHAEGEDAEASGLGSHAEGGYTTASGWDSHAEGRGTTASGVYSHAEGHDTTASNYHSHAEGDNTTASGIGSHAGGGYTHASRSYQTVIGKYNKILSGSGTTDSPYVSTDAAFIIGGGTARTTSNSKDIFSVGWDGNVELAIDSSATGSSTVDGKIMDSLRSLGWDASTEGVIV